MVEDNGLKVWVITYNPSDFPGKYVVRPQVADAEGVSPMAEYYVEDTLNEVRRHVPDGLCCLQRDPNDDPVIVECWI